MFESFKASVLNKSIKSLADLLKYVLKLLINFEFNCLLMYCFGKISFCLLTIFLGRPGGEPQEEDPWGRPAGGGGAVRR